MGVLTMIDEQFETCAKIHRATACTNELLTLTDYLTDEQKTQLVCQLVTFENSHIIAHAFTDLTVIQALYEELRDPKLRDI